MKVSPINIEYANRVISFTSKDSDLTGDFDDVVYQVHGETLRVEPHIIQNSRFEKIPGRDLYTYLLVPPGGESGVIQYGDGVDDEEINLTEEIAKDETLIEEAGLFAQDTDLPCVVLIDGSRYKKETIEGLPNLPNIFVLFAPYKASHTLPVVEAKSLLQKNASRHHLGVGIPKIRVKY